MLDKKYFVLFIHFAIIIGGILGCNMASTQEVNPPHIDIIPSPVYTSLPIDSTQSTSPIPSSTAIQTQTIHITQTVNPTLTPTLPTWEYLAPGVQRTFTYAPIPEKEGNIGVRVIRLDPALVRFQIFYDGDDPKLIDEWLSETVAELVINAGFFSSDHRPIGRVVIDGELYGTPFGTTGRVGTPGLFAVLGDDVSIYALGYSDYSPRGLRFEEAIEAYPMLLLPGQIVAYPEPQEEGKAARRTIIGIDYEGQVVIVLLDSGIYSLRQLALWLAISNLQLDSALNLDGGRSSGMAMDFGGEQEVIPSYVELPMVLAIYTRD